MEASSEILALITVWGVRVISAILILIAGWVIGNYLKNIIHKIKKLDETLKSFLGGLAKYTVFAVAIVTILGQFGVQTASLIAVLGAAGLAIGLALQGTLSNVASGVMLLILRPFNVGEFIDAGSISGTVKTLGLFGTELATADNVYIFVPNKQIWDSAIKNYNRNKQRRLDINAGISYGDDINKAFKVIEKVLKADKRLVTTEGKEPQVMVNAMGESSVDLLVRVWMTTPDYWTVKWDLTKAIKEALDKEGITIPFPTRTLEINAPIYLEKDKPKKTKAA
ncbi:MAG: mechanosensitive ion channel [Alphaproteobacteria bacterium]|nr:mechanosensitive ion channel [Alphaproteobacteria bacterium]